MKSLYESILSSTKSGEFRFTPDMLVRFGHSIQFTTQFDLEKMVKNFKIKPTLSQGDIIWQALCQLKTGKTKKEAIKALVHKFEWNGPEEPFFKDIFKDYLINPTKFDFFSYSEDDRKEVYIATHEKTGASRELFTLDLKKIQ